MTVLELLGRLRSQDVKVWVDGERLHVSAPKGSLTPALQAELADRKAELLALLRMAQGGATPPLRAMPRDGAIPPSFAQQRLWFLAQLEPGNPAYHISVSYRFRGRLDRAVLERALSEIVRRHEALRTRFGQEEGEPVQIVEPARPVPVPLIDLADLPERDRLIAAERGTIDEAHRPFDLASGPLFRMALFRFGPVDHALILTIHHVVSDGWSVGLFMRELGVLYDAFRSGRPSPLPELRIQYADFSLWQRQWLTEEVLERELTYWRTQLRPPLATLELPLDRPRPANQSSRGAAHSFALPADLSAALRTMARREGVTPFMLLLAAFKVLLHRYTGQEDILVGSPVANRGRVELEELIGFFTNTLVLRTDLSGEPTFRALLGRVREVTLGAHAHQEMPFEKLVEKLQPERDRSRNPLFQVSFVYQTVPEGDGLRVENVASPFDLTMYVRDGREGLGGAIEYCTDLFDASTIARMAGHFTALLAGIVADPDQTISRLPILTAAERQWLVHDLNATRTEYPRHHRIHELFEAQVAETPEAAALVHEATVLPYAEVNRRANRLAHHLRRLGVGRETLVGVWMERSPELIVALLGILKAGGAYVPFDLASPADRIGYMLQDAGIRVLVTQSRLLDRLPAHGAQVVCLDPGTGGIALGDPDVNPISEGSALDLAYVMYTSGSTGRPKGVMVPHRGVVRLVKNTNYARLAADEVFLQLAPVSFDASTLEIWGSLLNGARLVLFPGETPSLGELAEVLERHRVTILWLTAGLFHQVVEERLDALRPVRQLLAGGDVLSAPHARRVLECLPGCRLINGYGPTENTTFTCCYPMADPTQVGSSVSIGQPIANTRVYILDQHMQPVPVGVRGELWTGGDGLASGYFNRPDLTAERFVPDPVDGAPGDRLYRTGDFARYLPDGNIQFLGRADEQVKIRGYRIELGEIEASLMLHPAVKQAVVVVRDEPAAGKRLVAYLVAEADLRAATQEMRGFLKSVLADYMIPAAFVWLDQLPLTPNGKVDRRTLPAPIPEAAPADPGAAPGLPDELEVRLARLWEEALGVRPVGPRDNFFDLGGHSLLAVRLFARLEKESGRRLPLSLLFQAPTVGQLAALIRHEGWSPSWRSLVPIQPHGSRPPIFLIPGIGGNVLGYAGLVRLLGPDQPFYGLQARGLDGKEAPFTRIEDIAAHHIQEVRTVQPRGPYYLLGSCMGGVIAFEMSHQLLAQGESIGMLAMLETWPPQPTIFHAVLHRGFPGAVYLRLVGQRLVMYFRTLASLTPKERWAFIIEKAKLVRSMLAAGGPVGGARIEINRTIVERANMQALRRYVLRPYPGQILYIFAEGRPVPPEQDGRLVWRSFAAGGMEVHTLPCDDSGLMLLEPHVRLLATYLTTYLQHQASLRLGGASLPAAGPGSQMSEPWHPWDASRARPRMGAAGKAG